MIDWIRWKDGLGTQWDQTTSWNVEYGTRDVTMIRPNTLEQHQIPSWWELV